MTQLPENTEAAAEPNPLQWFLRDREYPCPRCGYSLRGLQSRDCPECGVALELSLVPVEVPLGLWIAALVAAAAGSGVAGLLFLVVASRSILSWDLLAVWGGALGLMAVQVWALIWFRSKFTRLPNSVQGAIAVIEWTLMCLLPALFLVQF